MPGWANRWQVPAHRTTHNPTYIICSLDTMSSPWCSASMCTCANFGEVAVPTLCQESMFFTLIFRTFSFIPTLLSFHPHPVNPLKLAYSRGTTPQDYTLETGVLWNSSKRYNSSNCDSGFGGQKPLVIRAIQALCFRWYLGCGSTTDNKGITLVFSPWV